MPDDRRVHGQYLASDDGQLRCSSPAGGVSDTAPQREQHLLGFDALLLVWRRHSLWVQRLQRGLGVSYLPDH
jgi:hypothetical protein